MITGVTLESAPITVLDLDSAQGHILMLVLVHNLHVYYSISIII